MKFPKDWNCPDFDIEEFVPPQIFKAFGIKSLWFIRRENVEFCQWLRTASGRPVKLNTWHNKGSLKNRGYRVPSETVGAELSQHKLSNAVDIQVVGWSTRRLFAFLVENYGIISFFGFTTIENIKFTRTWVHLDRRTYIPGIMPNNTFFVVDP